MAPRCKEGTLASPGYRRETALGESAGGEIAGGETAGGRNRLVMAGMEDLASTKKTRFPAARASSCTFPARGPHATSARALAVMNVIAGAEMSVLIIVLDFFRGFTSPRGQYNEGRGARA